MNAGLMGLGRFGRAGVFADNPLTPWFVLLGITVAALLWLYMKERMAKCRAEENFESIRAELQALRSRPRNHEFRVERFELLWFPNVSVSDQERVILGVSAGVPHCRPCLLPLSLDRGQWACRQCAARHPESLGDLMVIDSISKQALAWFQERHPGYRIAKA